MELWQAARVARFERWQEHGGSVSTPDLVRPAAGPARARTQPHLAFEKCGGLLSLLQQLCQRLRTRRVLQQHSQQHRRRRQQPHLLRVWKGHLPNRSTLGRGREREERGRPAVLSATRTTSHRQAMHAPLRARAQVQVPEWSRGAPSKNPCAYKAGAGATSTHAHADAARYCQQPARERPVARVESLEDISTQPRTSPPGPPAVARVKSVYFKAPSQVACALIGQGAPADAERIHEAVIREAGSHSPSRDHSRSCAHALLPSLTKEQGGWPCFDSATSLQRLGPPPRPPLPLPRALPLPPRPCPGAETLPGLCLGASSTSSVSRLRVSGRRKYLPPRIRKAKARSE